MAATSRPSPAWVHPLLWVVVGVFVLWACFMQVVGWMEQLTHKGTPLIEFLQDGVEMQERPVDVSDEEYDEILAAGKLTPEEQHHGPPGGALYTVPELFHMSAGGGTIMLWISYHMPFFVMGLAGWACFYFLKQPASVWRFNNRIRSVFSRPAFPVRWWASWFSNISVGEVFVYLVLIILPKITYAITRFQEQIADWNAGDVHDVNGLGHDFNEAQFWLREVAFWLGIDWLITLPVLFAFASRGSLLNTYLGVKYGTMLKWHRWLGAITLIEIITHGFLYQTLWLSGSWGTWVREMKRFDMGHVSNLPGAVAWGGAILMAAFLLPYMRRRAYKLFYYSHIFGAAVFMVFGTMHHRHTWLYAAAGLVVYGIDVAFRVYQTSLPVTVDVGCSAAKNIITVRIPVKKDVEYRDGGHVWLSIPRLDMFDYHPLSITSTPASPEWRSTMLLQCKVYDKWTQRMADAVASGFFDGPVDAKIQGPYDGHDMAGYEIDAYTRKLVLTGGVGIAAVLPMLKRMALHMESNNNKGAEDGKPKKVVVMHAARTAVELMLAAPLLKHSSVLDLRLHYTGDSKSLIDAQHTLPAPLPYDGPAHSRDISATGKDMERAGSSGGMHGAASYIPMRAVPGKWEALFVWTLSWFFSFWTLVMAEMWYESLFMSQASALSERAKWDRRNTNMAWMIFAMVLTVGVIPFALLCAWRIGRYYLFVGASGGASSAGSDVAMGAVAEGREDSITMPGAPTADVAARVIHAEVASIEVTGSAATLSLNSMSSAQVPIQMGRPDLVKAVNAIAATREGNDVMGVWSAGPKAMNNIVYEAAGRLGGDVRLFPLAYEM